MGLKKSERKGRKGALVITNDGERLFVSLLIISYRAPAHDAFSVAVQKNRQQEFTRLF